MSTAALVVTYNHCDFLKECLQTLVSQTAPVAEIFIIDNASTDQTAEVVANFKTDVKITYQRLEKNIGGAGGFNHGIHAICDRHEFDYVWLMDDDTMPETTAHAALLKSAKEVNDDFGFMVSRALWTDGSHAIMNEPKYLDDQLINNHLRKVSRGTFVSFFVKTTVVEKVGLPITDFFIWNDDTEYSYRISHSYKCYLDEASVVIHKMARNSPVDIISEQDPNRLTRYKYYYRNRWYVLKHWQHLGRLRYLKRFTFQLFDLLFSKQDGQKAHKVAIMFKGMFNGWKFKPQVEYVQPKKTK